MKGASTRRRREALDAMSQVAPALSSLFSKDGNDDGDCIISSVRSLSEGCEDAGILFVQGVMNQVLEVPPSTQSSAVAASSYIGRLETVLSELQQKVDSEAKTNTSEGTSTQYES